MGEMTLDNLSQVLNAQHAHVADAFLHNCPLPAPVPAAPPNPPLHPPPPPPPQTPHPGIH